MPKRKIELLLVLLSITALSLLALIVFLLVNNLGAKVEDDVTAGTYSENADATISILIQPKPYQYITEQEEDYSAKIEQWEEEHYYATKVWEYLRQKGFNQEITCGIIGNMMIETSGGSLDLKPNIYNPSGNYYGLCQWSKKYYPEAHGLSFEQQLEFLLNNIEWEINTFGKNYKTGFKYKDFLAMDDPAEAALAFAKSYERCGSASYEMRQDAAEKAYEYFDLNS
jgi:hypothetical protein